MRAAMASLLALGVALPAAATPARRYRFHPLYQGVAGKRSFADRLKPGTKAALRGVVNIDYASGFVVHDDGAGKGLVLTNEHVVRKGLPAGYQLFFFDRAIGTVSRVLTTDPELDYALVEVALPAGAPRAMTLAPDGLRAGRRIYTLAGYANLGVPDASGQVTMDSLQPVVGGTRAARQAIVDGYYNQFATALGVFGRSVRVQEIPVAGGEIDGVEANLPNATGMSGSPVLARGSDAVVGLHSSGVPGDTRPWTETSVPLRLILGDLDAKLKAGAFDAAGQASVGALLRANEGTRP